MSGTCNRVLRRVAFFIWICAAHAAHAQSGPLNTTPSRLAIDEATRAGCEGVSVVARQCLAQPEPGRSDKTDDPLTRSRARAKAAFDRRDRRTRQDAQGGSDDAVDGASAGKAQRLAPVVVTGSATELPLTIEEILQRALNPQQVVSPNGTVTTYGADGTRTECIARCIGPMCCATVRARPDPARQSNSIGR